MARIRLAEDHELDQDTKAVIDQIHEATGDTTALRALAHRPDILMSFMGFYGPLQMEGLLNRKLVELVRLSIAQINQCSACLAGRYQDAFDDGLTEGLIEQLPFAEQSDAFTDREKAAIAFAQTMASDHWSVNDDDFARLYEYFNEKEVVELVMDVAQFIGIGRAFAVMDAMNTECSVPMATSASA